jgi:hypothetical protein
MTETKNQNPWQDLPELRRELYLSVIDSYHDLHEIALRLHFLDNHFPLEKLDIALKWLVVNKITGGEFVAWFKYSCKGSDLEMHRLLLAIIDHLKLAPIISGRNFRA